jgi:hypothetical protein
MSTSSSSEAQDVLTRPDISKGVNGWSRDVSPIICHGFLIFSGENDRLQPELLLNRTGRSGKTVLL